MTSRFLHILIFLTALATSSLKLVAQKEFNHWYFGGYCGVDFNPTSPNLLSNSALATQAGSATISDEYGNLLFYAGHDINQPLQLQNSFTAGVIFNKFHQPMSNGTGLIIAPVMDATMAIPDPGNSDRYYLFHIGVNPTQSFTYRHYFSIIDMAANNGLGDVVVKNQLMHASVSMRQTAVLHQNNLDVWIVGVEHFNISTTPNIYAYQLTQNGLVNNAVLSPSVPQLGFYSLHSQMKTSPDGTKIAFGGYRPYIFDFNASTGIANNGMILSVANGNASVFIGGHSCRTLEFSKSGRFLYIDGRDTTNSNPGALYQFDLVSNVHSTIDSSRVVVGPTGNPYGYLQRGPDEKIYHIGPDSLGTTTGLHLNRIENPDSAGLISNYAFHVINFPAGTGTDGSFPKLTPNILGLTFRDSITCFGDTSFFELTTRAYDSVLWNFGDTASGSANFSTDTLGKHVFSAPGTYDVTLTWVWNGMHDTVVRPITIYPQPYANLGPDTILCEGDSMAIQFADSSFSYLWKTGDTMMNLQILQADTYHVEVSNVCGLARDTVVIDSLIPALVDLPLDTVFCQGNQLLLDASVALGTYQWSTGDTTASILADSSGVYSVTATNLCGSSSDTIDIGVMPLVNADLGNDTAICVGNWVLLDVNDTASTYLWDDGTTAPQRWINSTGMYRVSITNMCGTKEDSLQLWSLTTPSIDLGTDTVLCPGEVYTVGDSVLFGNFTWSTGATTDSISITSQNTYSVTVDNGCGTDADTVQVWYDSSPLTELGPDATYCITQLITLDASHSRATYLWQDGSTDSSLLADTSGQYWVEVTNLCGFDDDTVQIKYDVPIFFSLGADTAICDYDSILLDAPAVNATYQWNTGSTDSLLYANAGQTYFVRATNACGSFSDSIDLGALYIPQVDFPDGDTICEGGVLTARVESSNATNFLWNDGNTDNERKFHNSGTYSVAVTNICGTVEDSLTLLIAPYPEPELGPDTILCLGESFELSVDNISQNHTYTWSTGETDSAITIQEDGVYAVTVTSPYNCEGYDEIEVRACGTTLYIPTAFTPNGDGLNDVFKVEGTDITRFYIAIYNRWGNQVFESTDPTIAWDGTFQNQGEPVNPGVFSYVLWYASGQYQSEEISGSVSIIR